MKKLFIITGEYSGDMHAARVVKQLQAHDSGIQIEAIGGVNLQETGIKLYGNHSKMSAAGFSLKILFDHLSLGKNLVDYLKNEYKPDMVLLIDYGGFNLNISRILKKEMPDIKIFYYIPPQIWASRKWRLNTVKRYIDKVLTIFPFEKQMYDGKGIDSEFVGHPLIEEFPPRADKAEFFAKNSLSPDKKLISIFPGSRAFEIKMLMAVYVKAIENIKAAEPDVQFALAQAPNIKDELLAKYKIPSYVKILKNSNYPLLSLSDVLMLASGTVALEAALYSTPMVISYRGPWLLYFIYLMVRSIDRVSLPNIILQKDVVKELVQHLCTPKNISAEILGLLNNAEKNKNMRHSLEQLQNMLSEKNAAVEVAKNIKNAL